MDKQLIIDTLHQQLKTQAEDSAAKGYYNVEYGMVVFDGSLDLEKIADAIIEADKQAKAKKSVEYRVAGDGRPAYLEKLAKVAPKEAAKVLRADSRTLDFRDHFRLTAAPQIIALLADRPFTVIDKNPKPDAEVVIHQTLHPVHKVYQYSIVFSLTAEEHLEWAKTMMHDFWDLMTRSRPAPYNTLREPQTLSAFRDIDFIHRSPAGDTEHYMTLNGIDVDPSAFEGASSYTLHLNANARIPATLIGTHNEQH